jgi:hypothetical protein
LNKLRSKLAVRARAVASGVRLGRKPTLPHHQKQEAIKRRDKDGETLRSIGRSCNVSAATSSRLQWDTLKALTY